MVEDTPSDLSGAPYPVILSSSKVGSFFAPHLVSYGFVYVGIRNIDTYEQIDQNLIDQPLDILFALDQVASQPLEGLEGMLDTDRAGTMGYSFAGAEWGAHRPAILSGAMSWSINDGSAAVRLLDLVLL